MFKSENELDKFNYMDCVLNEIVKHTDDLTFDVAGLIVEPNNSQNTNYTRSYAGGSKIIFKNGVIEKIIKEGHKYFDADGNLKEEVPDKELNIMEMTALLPTFKDIYLYDLQLLPGENACVIGVELKPEDIYDSELSADSYQMKVTYDNAVVTWDKYLNRVQD